LCWRGSHGVVVKWRVKVDGQEELADDGAGLSGSMASDVEYWQRWKGREGLAVPRQRCWRCRRSSEGFAKVGGGAAAHSACND